MKPFLAVLTACVLIAGCSESENMSPAMQADFDAGQYEMDGLANSERCMREQTPSACETPGNHDNCEAFAVRASWNEGVPLDRGWFSISTVNQSAAGVGDELELLRLCREYLSEEHQQCVADCGYDPIACGRCVLGSGLVTGQDFDGDGIRNSEDNAFPDAPYIPNTPDGGVPDVDVERCSSPVGTYDVRLAPVNGEECSAWPSGFADGTIFDISVSSGSIIEIAANEEDGEYTISKSDDAGARCVAQLNGCVLSAQCSQHDESPMLGLFIEWTFTSGGFDGASTLTTLIDLSSTGSTVGPLQCTERYPLFGARRE